MDPGREFCCSRGLTGVTGLNLVAPTAHLLITSVAVMGIARSPKAAQSLVWDNIITLGGPSSIEFSFLFSFANDQTQGGSLT